MRAVVDTNIWVRGLIGSEGKAARIIEAYIDGRFDLITAERLIEELQEKLGSGPIARRLRVSDAVVQALVAGMREESLMVDLPRQLSVCSDPDLPPVIQSSARAATRERGT